MDDATATRRATLRHRLHTQWGVPYTSVEMADIDELLIETGTPPTRGPSNLDELVAALSDTGWSIERVGTDADLWSHPDGRHVAVHHELTAQSWEWPGTLERAGLPV